MASSIGIKIANGEFYPLIEENSFVKKKMILTTVHNNQPSVQVDLYRSSENVMEDAQYIGSLVVENIKPRPKGEPSIEMIISSNANGEIVADAVDLDAGPNGEHYMMTVSLKTLDETSRDMEIHDFDLDSGDDPPMRRVNETRKIKREKRRKPTWLFLLIGLIVILGLLAAWLFFMGGLDTVQSKWPVVKHSVQDTFKQIGSSSGRRSTKDVSPSVTVTPPVSPPVAEPAKPPEPVQQKMESALFVPAPVIQAPVIQAPATPPAVRPQTARVRPPAPVMSYNVPATIPREGVNYTIRWGDTLWDISAAFYRDPWLYPRIARHNNISNPNYIISGRTIRIPPKN